MMRMQLLVLSSLLVLPLSSHELQSPSRPQVRPFVTWIAPGEQALMAGSLRVFNRSSAPVEARVQYRVSAGWQLDLLARDRECLASIIVERGSQISILAESLEIFCGEMSVENALLKSL